MVNQDRKWAPEPTITHSPLGQNLAPGALHMCYAQVQGLELGEEKLPRPSGRASKSLVFSPCQLVRLTWLHSGYRANREAHWLPIPNAGLVTSQQTPSGKSGQMSATNGSNDPTGHHQFGQLQMAPMTPFDTIIWPIFPKGNRPMTRPQKSTPGPNRASKVPS